MTQNVAPITRTVVVRCAPPLAYSLFTEKIGSWWPLGSHSVFADEAATVSFEDGLLVERARDGRTATWGEVLVLEPSNRLSFTWHPGRAEGPDTVVTVTFTPQDDGTRVDLEHTGWEVFGDSAGQHRSGYASEGGWQMVIQRFVDFSVGTRPVR